MPADTLSPAFPFLAPFIYCSVKLSLCDHLLQRYYSPSSPSWSFHLGPVALGLLPLCLCCQALRCSSIRLGQIQRSFRRLPQGVKKANSGCLDQYVARSVIPHSAETADVLKCPAFSCYSSNPNGRTALYMLFMLVGMHSIYQINYWLILGKIMSFLSV